MLHTTIAGADAGAQSGAVERRWTMLPCSIGSPARMARRSKPSTAGITRWFAAFPRAGHPATADRRGDPERHDAGGLAQGVELQPALAGIDLDFRHCISARVEGAAGGSTIPSEYEPDASSVRGQRRALKACWLAQAMGRHRIAKALDALVGRSSCRHRLTYFEGYSCAEIAEIMRCPVSTVKTRMFHARRRLRHAAARPQLGMANERTGSEIR